MIYGPCTVCGNPATIKAGGLRLCNNHKDHKAPEEVVKPAVVEVVKPALRGRRR